MPSKKDLRTSTGNARLDLPTKEIVSIMICVKPELAVPPAIAASCRRGESDSCAGGQAKSK